MSQKLANVKKEFKQLVEQLAMSSTITFNTVDGGSYRPFPGEGGLTTTLGTLRNTTPSTRRGGQFIQLISLSPGNTYQLKKLAAMSC